MSGVKKRLKFSDDNGRDDEGIVSCENTELVTSQADETGSNNDERMAMQVNEERQPEQATMESSLTDTEIPPLSTPQTVTSSCARSNGTATHSKEIPPNNENGSAPEQLTESCVNTPGKMRQLKLMESFALANNSTPAKDKSSYMSTPATPNPHDPQTPLNKVKKRKITGSTSFTKKRNKSQTPKGKTPSKRNDTSLSDDSNDGMESDPEDDNTSSSMGTLQHLSIHLLPVTLLQSKFGTGDKNLSEEELITDLMEEVNGKQSFVFTKDEPTVTFQDAKGFKTLLYTQTVGNQEPLHFTFGVTKLKTHNNTIIFYLRAGDIFALTNRNAWQAIQEHCSYKFPCQISNRVTSEQGNLYEDTYHITGNVQNSKTTKRSATGGLGRLERITINKTKAVRHHSSMYRLKEFQNLVDSKKKECSQVQIQFGLANVRIMKKMNAENIPEKLDHFSKICRSEETRTLDDRVEDDLDDMPYIQPVSNEKSAMLNDKMYTILREYICHNEEPDEILTFDLVDKHYADYFMAEDFRLIHKGNIIYRSQCAPKFMQVFFNIRHHCGNELEGSTDEEEKGFQNFRLNLSKIRLHYITKGSEREISRGIMQLVDGEMHLDEESYWRLMGRWWSLREEYYSDLHHNFVKTLKKCANDRCDILPKPWDRNRVRTVSEYTSLYRNFDGDDQLEYFHPPGNGSQGGNNIDPQHFFDMFGVRKEKGGNLSFFLFYIYDRFDAGIRFASMRIAKSLDMLFKPSNSKGMFQAFREAYRDNERFSQIFKKISSFKMLKGSKMKMEVVVAFATGQERLQIQPKNKQLLISGFLRAARLNNGEEDIRASLAREKGLLLVLDTEVLKTTVLNSEAGLSAENLRILWKEMNSTEDPINLDCLAQKIRDKLVEKGYINESDGLISGKFLKLRGSRSFKLFENPRANNEMFKTLKQLCTSGFPGFIHKLECLLIHALVVKDAEMSVSLTDIHSSGD